MTEETMKVDGKVVIITGGAQGLGKAFALELLKNKAKVCICDIHHQNGERTRKELAASYGDHVMFLQCDVTNHDSFEDVFKKVISRYGRIDVVVNNAGVGGWADSWRTTILVNTIGVIEGTKLAEQYMSKQNGGRGGVVVNMGSTAGLTPVFYIPVYAASKYGVVGYTRSMAYHPEIAKAGMRYVCLCPAFTDTSMFTSSQSEVSNRHAHVHLIVQNTGINTVESVVEAFMQLLTTDNNNGGVMTVSKQRGIEYRHGRPRQNKL